MIVGVAPAETVTMRVTVAGGSSLAAEVANGTFALVLPASS